MNSQDLKILKAINNLSTTTFVSATEVSDKWAEMSWKIVLWFWKNRDR